MRFKNYLNEAKLTKQILNNTVKKMQLYLGSLDKTRIRDQEKLRNRLDKSIDKIADITNMDVSDIWDQIETEAIKKGKITPIPGRDI